MTDTNNPEQWKFSFRDPKGKRGVWLDGRKVSTSQFKFLMNVFHETIQREKEGSPVDGMVMKEALRFSSTSAVYEQAERLLKRGLVENVATGSREWNLRLTKKGYAVLKAFEIASQRGFVNL